MQPEDSYEGAIQRLRRLGHAGIDLPSATAQDEHPRDELRERMQDLEELAQLACNENDRLERELASARAQIDRLQQLVTTLQQTMIEPALDVPRRKGPRYVAVAIVIAGAAALIVLRPWQRYLPAAASVGSVAVPAAVPVAPPVVVEPPKPAVAPPAATVAAPAPPATRIPSVAAAQPAPAKATHHRVAGKRRHHTHHAKHRVAAAHTASDDAKTTDDPLAGLAQ